MDAERRQMTAQGLWRLRELFFCLFKRELGNSYSGHLAGFFSIMVNPLVQLAVYAFVFKIVFKVRFPELSGQDFVAFVATAMWPWMAFQIGVQKGLASIEANRNLVKKVWLPHEFLVYASVGSIYVIQITGFIFVILVLYLTDFSIHVFKLPFILPVLILQFIFTAGLALIFAALKVFVEDLGQAIAPLFTVWFYATPVLYPISLAPIQLRNIIELNPMTYCVSRIRDVILYNKFQIGLMDAFQSVAIVLFFIFARLFFNRLSPYFENVL
ncbi:MAG: ABC transporter permease [Dissulfurimicrobium sp.]|uniref:ABC transporter permease n=1 Tax=Dissulfurimicrobium TaxID=1769732 RepID=UPI001EDC7C5E|nr:ABC transporter permease [Dissulfurimicrobium hydrothermale]UKL14393.1 ABC transporter permease [Dissulfurimicrobium hydrothermale]